MTIRVEADLREMLETGTVTLHVDRETLRMITFLVGQHTAALNYRQLHGDLIELRDRAGWGPEGSGD